MTSLNGTDTYVNGTLLETPWEKCGVQPFYKKIDIVGAPYITRVVIHEEFGHRKHVGGRCSRNSDGSLPGTENLELIYCNIVDCSRTSVIPASQLRNIGQRNPALITHLQNITRTTR